MRKFWSLALVAAVACSLPVIADGTPGTTGMQAKTTDMRAMGKITTWDAGTKMFTMTMEDGKTMSFHWNDTTNVHGTPKVGEMVRVDYTKDTSGMMMARKVFVGATMKGDAQPTKH